MQNKVKQEKRARKQENLNNQTKIAALTQQLSFMMSNPTAGRNAASAQSFVNPMAMMQMQFQPNMPQLAEPSDDDSVEVPETLKNTLEKPPM